jgi:hypothetical protein
MNIIHSAIHIKNFIYNLSFTTMKKYYTAVVYECQMNGFLSGLFGDVVQN